MQSPIQQFRQAGLEFVMKMKKRFLSKLYPHKLVNKLFLAICVIGIFLVISLGITVAAISGHLLYQDAKELLVSQSKQVTNAFDQYAEILKNTAMTASRQSSIQHLFSDSNSLYDDYITYRDSYSYVKNIHAFYEWIDVYLLVKDKHYMMSTNEKDTISDYRTKAVDEQEWFIELENAQSGTLMQPNFISPTDKESAFSFAYTMRNYYNWKIDGYILVTLDKAILKKLLSETGIEENGVMLIFTPDGKSAYNSAPDVFSSDMVNEQLYTQLKNGDKYVNKNHEEYVYSSCKSETTGWDFVVLSNTRQAKSQIFGFQLSVLFVVMITLALLFIVARLIANLYTRPIKQVIAVIGQAEKNEFALQCELQPDGELGDLVNSFNEMVVSVRQNQILRKRAEIDALQKQIDPHFLFNTFESIKVLAKQRQTNAVVSMIEQLSDIFRYNINRNNSQTSRIQEEITLIRNYLAIQSVRFGSRMQIDYAISEEVMPYTTLKFILQPIVENSIRHSLEEMISGYRLEIKCGFEGDSIVFSVKDNGVGISEEKLSLLKAHVFGLDKDTTSEAFGIGLKNIQERIVLFYGNEYGLSIDSVLGEFTQVKVQIPKVSGKE